MSAERLSHEELSKKVEEASEQVKVGGVYHHWRDTNQLYKVLFVGLCEWDQSLSVIYQQMNVEHPLTWVRKLDGEGGWLTPADNNGNPSPRFILVD